MRLEYRPSVLEQIIDAVFTAEDSGRELERVVLTRAEWAELAAMKPGGVLEIRDGETYVAGIRVVEDTRPTITVKRDSAASPSPMHQ